MTNAERGAHVCFGELLAQLKKVLGYVPIGTRDLLRVLAHPDVIEYTKAYLRACDEIHELPLHRTAANIGVTCGTCDGGGCPDCTDPA